MRTSTITKKIARIFCPFFLSLHLAPLLLLQIRHNRELILLQICRSFHSPVEVFSVVRDIMGYSFLVFENTSNSNITIGHIPVAPGESITIGTFGNRSVHSGIWYNIEGCCGVSSTSYGLRTSLTPGGLLLVNEEIRNHDSWSLLNNCSVFARDVWNAGNSGSTLTGSDPPAIVNSIKIRSGYITNPSIPSKSLNSIARHTSSSYSYDASGANPG